MFGLAELALPTLFAIELTPLLADAFVLISIESIDDLLLFNDVLVICPPFRIVPFRIATADATVDTLPVVGVFEPDESISEPFAFVVPFELVFDSCMK